MLCIWPSEFIYKSKEKCNKTVVFRRTENYNRNRRKATDEIDRYKLGEISKGNWMKRFLGKKIWTGVLTLAVLFCATAFSARASDDTQITVRVGFPEFPGFSQTSEDGVHAGYSYEYLMEIARYTGWRYEFVQGTAEELSQQLLDGDVDIMGSMLKNESTQEYFDYPEYSCGNSFTVLVAREDNTRFHAGNVENFYGMRVAVYKNAHMRIEALKKFCEINGVGVSLVYFDSEKEQREAINNGRADAYIATDLVKTDGTKILARFDQKPYYMAVTKGKASLVRGLNFAISKINEHDIYYNEKLYNKYFQPSHKTEVVLTEQEKAYVERNPRIKVAVIADWEPISYWDDENSSYRGIALDVLKKTSDITGITFEYLPLRSLEQAMQWTSSGRCDMMMGMQQNFELSEKYNVTVTTPYLLAQNMLVTRKDSPAVVLNESTAAAVKGSSLWNIAPGDVVWFDNAAACIEAVRRKTVAFTACNVYSTEAIIRPRTMQNLKISAIPGQEMRVGFGINREVSGNLTTILEKTIDSITNDEIQAIISNHLLYNKNEISIQDLVYRYPIQIILVATLLIALIAWGITALLRARYKQEQTMVGYEKSYRILADTIGEVGFVYNCQRDELVLFGRNKNILSERDSEPHFGERLKAGAFPTSVGAQDFKKMFDNLPGKKNGSFELRCQKKDGVWSWYRATYTVVCENGLRKRPAEVIGLLANIDAERREKEELLDLSQSDKLTGLLNRVAAERIIKEILETRTGCAGMLILIDIDYFKQFNDRLGHMVGDDVLHAMGNAMKKVFRQDDVLCRWGGDEFLIFVKNISEHQIVKERLNQLRAEMKSYQSAELDCPVSLSAGGVTAHKGADFGELFLQADRALYAVKETGRDGVLLDWEDDAPAREA